MSVMRKDWLENSVCVVATGGYARKMLCPHSDVDLVLISRQPADETLAQFSRHLLYPLWDAGLDVGCRPGSIEEILAAAETDITARTALLDLRLVAGSKALYGQVVDAVESAFLRWGPDLLASVRTENLLRFQRYGESVFLLEPQVKEGKGGLRDFHWLLWIARLRHGARGDYDLLLNGLVEERLGASHGRA